MRRHSFTSRVVPRALVLLALSMVPQAGVAEPPSAPREQQDPSFRDFLASLWPLAQAKGVRRGTFDTALAGLEPDPAAPRPAAQQAEFDKPVAKYLAEAVSRRRLEQGRAILRQWAATLAAIESRYGVPREIVVAAYGLETDYGKAMGGKDSIRTLATLAYMRKDREIFRDELIDALVIIDRGTVPRDKLRGSWAGAMGGPQFLPSAYLKHAVAFEGDGAPDIWDRPADIFASIANFLRASGWTPGLPWGLEVRLPAGFDFAFLRNDFRAFAARGVAGAGGSPLPASGTATLFLPAGVEGPAFLLSDNYWVLKAYNNSDSYALSLGRLADRLLGAPDLERRWPSSETLLSRTEKAEMQQLLARLGFYKGTIDGRFGQASRDAIHAFQKSVAAFPADGYGSAQILRQLREKAAVGRP